MDILIVSRHAAAVEFIRRTANLPDSVPVVSEVGPNTDLNWVVVYGNLPLHLAARCLAVVAVEFAGQPPRGTEYTSEQMRDAGARLRVYKVRDLSAAVLQNGVGVAVAVPLEESDGMCYGEIGNDGVLRGPGETVALNLARGEAIE